MSGVDAAEGKREPEKRPSVPAMHDLVVSERT
jgi:hypothetical protein